MQSFLFLFDKTAMFENKLFGVSACRHEPAQIHSSLYTACVFHRLQPIITLSSCRLHVIQLTWDIIWYQLVTEHQVVSTASLKIKQVWCAMRQCIQNIKMGLDLHSLNERVIQQQMLMLLHCNSVKNQGGFFKNGGRVEVNATCALNQWQALPLLCSNKTSQPNNFETSLN